MPSEDGKFKVGTRLAKGGYKLRFDKPEIVEVVAITKKGWLKLSNGEYIRDASVKGIFPYRVSDAALEARAELYDLCRQIKIETAFLYNFYDFDLVEKWAGAAFLDAVKQFKKTVYRNFHDREERTKKK